MKRLLPLLLLLTASLITVHAEDEIISFKLSSRNGLPDNNIRSIKQDSLGYMYFRSLYATYRYDGYRFERLSADEALRMDSTLSRHAKSVTTGTSTDNRGNSFTVEPSGQLTYEDRTTGECVQFPIFAPEMLKRSDNLKVRVLTDRRGLIWVSVNGNGLFVYNRRSGLLRHITDSDPQQLIDNNYVVYIKEDRDGHIWVSQEHYGLACLTVRQRNYDLIDLNGPDDHHDNIRMLQRLGADTVLIADNYGSLYRSDALMQHITPLTQGQENILSALRDPQGRLWIGSRLKGVCVDGRWYGEGRVDCMTTDHRGRVWLCGIKGPLVQATLTADGRYTERRFLSDVDDLSPRVLVADTARRCFWLGTKQGLFRFNPDSLLADSTAITRVAQLPVLSLLIDSHQRLWIGTRGQGVYRMDGPQGTQIEPLENDLPNSVVQLLAEDGRGRIYIGTEDGLACYDAETGRFVGSLFFSDNLTRNYYNEGAAVTLADGRVALATLSGIVVTGGQDDEPAATDERLALTGVAVNGSMTMPDSLQTADGTLVLAHDQNSLSLHFSNFAYGHQRQVLYSYRLRGYDRDWSTASPLNMATYKNLPPGRYTFEVRCQNGWGSDWQPLHVALRIMPPWWRTWWAYLIYIIVVAAIGYAIYRQVRHVARLHQAVAVEKQLTEYKLKFFTNISHEFRTPLTLIQGSMDKLKNLPGTPSTARAPLSTMQRNVDRLLRLINQLLEFRRMQNNKLSLSLEETDVVAFVYNICQTFHDVADQQRIHLAFSSPVKSLSAYIDRGFIDKAVYNLLSNAFKYTSSGGSVTVRLANEELRMKNEEFATAPQDSSSEASHAEANSSFFILHSSFKIVVEDTGVGVPEDMREKIFNRFERGQLRSDSLGIGLDLTAELIRTHHGTITCEANPEGQGSLFTITLPTDKGVYAPQDFLADNAPGRSGSEIERKGFEEAVREVMPEPMNDYRVLVVEDDAEIAAYLRQELGRYFQVEVARDGEEALAILNEELRMKNEEFATASDSQEDSPSGAVANSSFFIHHSSFQLIVTDVMMPRMNGYELLRRLRHNPATRHLPVVMLTALDAETDMAKGLEVGADAYITKPFSLQLLLLQCRNLLQRNIHAAATTAEHATAAPVAGVVLTDERDRRLLAQLEAWVGSHLASSELSVDKFAADMGYGRTTFYNKLKELTGKTPNEYIKEMRLQRAAELLKDDHVTVAEVAYQVGMATPQYLSTTFKKRFGITPTQYQKGAKQ